MIGLSYSNQVELDVYHNYHLDDWNSTVANVYKTPTELNSIHGKYTGLFSHHFFTTPVLNRARETWQLASNNKGKGNYIARKTGSR